MTSSTLPALPYPDPAFRFLPGNHELLPDPPDQAMLDFLCYTVTQRPADLISHIRRILLSQARGNAAQTYGALIDLFIAVGPKAADLRQTMLRRCANILTPEQHDWLLDRMASGLQAGDVSASAHSRLATGKRSILRANAFFN